MTTQNRNEPPQRSDVGSPKESPCVRIFAVGRAGAAIAEELIRNGFDPESFVILKTGAAAPAKQSASKKIRLQAGTKRGATVGRSAGELLPKIKELCKGADLAFVLAGMGGRIGTEFAPLVAKAAKEAGLVTLGFTTLPFDCEGGLKQAKARAGLEALKAVADGVVCLPNQKVSKVVDESTSLLDTFKVSNGLLGDCVRGVARMMTSGGLIDIHLSDLCALIGGQHAGEAFATAEVSGPNRSREVVEKLLAHPLLDGGQVLRDAEAVLVSVVGGRDMAMADVNRIMEQINQQCENVPVIMGAAIDESLAGRLAVTLLAGQAAVSAGPLLERTGSAARRADTDLNSRLLPPSTASRHSSRIAALSPDLTQEGMKKMLAGQGSAAARRGKGAPGMRQTQLQLEIVSKGRFDKSEPTIHNGEDLDLPTYVRRGVVLN